jgi:RNA polymerase sigma factor (sigma-70 family)
LTVPLPDRVADLVRRARNPRASIRDRHAAFSALVERFEAMALATALPACDDTELARDACQEAFLLAWRTLPRLNEPAAFGGWLKRLIRTQCARARHRHRAPDRLPERGAEPAEPAGRLELQRRLKDAVSELPATEREAITLFYALGEPLTVVARQLGLSVGRAGRTLYDARLRLRHRLPRSIAEDYLVRRPTTAFTRRVRAGVFDDLVGEYRFPNRPDHVVLIRREGQMLVGYAGGQRNVLASRKADALNSTEFDGEGRFQRDAHGRVNRFVYYEFGRRLGVARKVVPSKVARGRGAPAVS